MKLLRSAFALVPLCMAMGAFTPAATQAALLCDCTQVVDACSASVSLEGTRVSIESSNDSCSRVDYLVEGQPFTALIVDGSGDLAWQGQPLRDAAIVVESCRVCAENGAEGEPTDSPFAGTIERDEDTNAEADEDAGELRSIIKVMPEYPRQAWMNKQEGEVLVEFSVNQQGVVQNIKVISSTSPLFDLPAIDAVSRFRYQPAADNGSPKVTTGVRERFYFRLLQGGAQPNVSSAAG